MRRPFAAFAAALFICCASAYAGVTGGGPMRGRGSPLHPASEALRLIFPRLAYPTYSDDFNRIDGSLGPNWTTPDVQEIAPLISTDQIVAGASGGTQDSIAYYKGNFALDQYSVVQVEDIHAEPSTSYIGSSVRFRKDGANGWYTGYVWSPTRYGIIIRYPSGAWGPENNYTSATDIFADGDSLKTQAITYPFGTVISLFHNDTLIYELIDSTYNFDAGNPGIQLFSASGDSYALDNWQGGSLTVNLSSTLSDDFTRSDAGWLGPNWVSPSLDTMYFKLSSNEAVPIKASPTSADIGLVFWHDALSVNQSSEITISGVPTGADWLGAVVRGDISQPFASSKFYIAFAYQNSVDLYEYAGGQWNGLGSLGSHTFVAGDKLKLEATGTAPVALAVYINGSQLGSTVNDSTYLLSGTYAGFCNYGGTESSVSYWTGGNL